MIILDQNLGHQHFCVKVRFYFGVVEIKTHSGGYGPGRMTFKTYIYIGLRVEPMTLVRLVGGLAKIGRADTARLLTGGLATNLGGISPSSLCPPCYAV
jgi:hypothetical protein